MHVAAGGYFWRKWTASGDFCGLLGETQQLELTLESLLEKRCYASCGDGLAGTMSSALAPVQLPMTSQVTSLGLCRPTGCLALCLWQLVVSPPSMVCSVRHS